MFCIDTPNIEMHTVHVYKVYWQYIAMLFACSSTTFPIFACKSGVKINITIRQQKSLETFDNLGSRIMFTKVQMRTH